jgi:hypothetical protein
MNDAELLARIEAETSEALALAEGQVSAEVLGENVVKENYWRGEVSALRRLREIMEDAK